MTPKIKVISRYRPRLDKGKTVQHPELIRNMAHGTGLMEGSVDHNVKELRDKIIFYCCLGHAVKVEGLGTWAPGIGLDGKININYRPDPHFIFTINTPGMFNGKIENRENIGKTVDELVTKWNQEHPDDPVDLSEVLSTVDSGADAGETLDFGTNPPPFPPPLSQPE